MKWTNKGHELDFIGERFKTRKQIYIYGTGARGQLCYERLSFLNCTVGFIDGNIKKRESGFMGLPVFGIEQIDAAQKEHSLIVIAAGPNTEGIIAKTLLFHGFLPENDFYYMDSFLNAYLQIYAMYAHNKLMVYLNPQSVTERCTLKCVHCNHSLPYLKDPVNFKKEEFIADLDLFFSHVDYIYSADFVGGEPFVHPDFYEMMKYAAEHYRSRMFRMLFVTNGTIVPSDEILELMKKYNIQFLFSDYRANAPQISRSVEAFLQRVEKSGVSILRNDAETWSDYALGRADIQFADEAEKIRYFDFCGTPCRYMRHGRLYYCTSDRLAQRAGLVEEDPDSYLDLGTMTPERRMEILEFDLGFNTKGYLNTCTKCNGAFFFNTAFVPKGVQCTPEQLQSFPKQCHFPGIKA